MCEALYAHLSSRQEGDPLWWILLKVYPWPFLPQKKSSSRSQFYLFNKYCLFEVCCNAKYFLLKKYLEWKLWVRSANVTVAGSRQSLHGNSGTWRIKSSLLVRCGISKRDERGVSGTRISVSCVFCLILTNQQQTAEIKYCTVTFDILSVYKIFMTKIFLQNHIQIKIPNPVN